jgi:hypothetical protein
MALVVLGHKQADPVTKGSVTWDRGNGKLAADDPAGKTLSVFLKALGIGQ